MYSVAGRAFGGITPLMYPTETYSLLRSFRFLPLALRRVGAVTDP